MPHKLSARLKDFLPYALPILKGWQKISNFVTDQHQITILTFHDIPTAKFLELRQFLHVLSRNYSFITPAQFENAMRHKENLPPNPLLLTFDDGMKSSYEAWHHVLRPLGIRAAFFICPAYLAGHQNTPKDHAAFVAKNLHLDMIRPSQTYPGQWPMSVNDARELIREGNLVGSHSYSHAALSKITDEAQREKEIAESKSELERMLGTSITWFAFPFGAIEYIDRASLALIQKHYQFCFSNIRGSNNLNTNPMCLRRQNINIHQSLQDQLFIVWNGLNLLYRKKAQRLDMMLQSDLAS